MKTITTTTILPLLLLFAASPPQLSVRAFSTQFSFQKNARVVGGNDRSSGKTFMIPSSRRKRGNHLDKNALVMMPSGTPMVPWQPPGQEYAQFMDIYSRLYRDRIMLIGQFIDEEAANNIISILLYLRHESKTDKITLYFNVPGALLRPALAVYDLICQCRDDCEVSTLNLGLATGMGALLCGAGTKGLRCSMPNARFLLQRTGIDEPFQGQASDIGLEVGNIKKSNDRMEMELARMTGQPISKVRSDMQRDFYLSSEEAVAYGLIDHVLLPPTLKGYKEVEYERDPWTGEKHLKTEAGVDLGQFGGADEQRYGGQKGGGWGSGWKVEERDGDDNDGYEPPTQK